MATVRKWGKIFPFMVLFIFISFVINGQSNQDKWSSLDSRPIPAWFEQAKVGVHIQWGPYSVAAWSPNGSFASWYQYWLINRTVSGNGDYLGSEVYDYHQKKYGPDVNYYDLSYDFKAISFDPDDWIKTVQAAGAKYVIFSAKHLDGYCLWPSKEANDRGFNWNSLSVGPKQDLVGQFKVAVNSTDLKWGLSYALQEWFHPWWSSDKKKFVRDHLHPQIKDLVDTYKPDILWTTGDWELSSEEWNAAQLVSWIYNQSKAGDGIVLNDRWGKDTRHLHGGYHTTEYSIGADAYQQVWEEHRALGFSMGYNRNEDLDSYASSQALILTLSDIVSRGGNLLINIGPDGDGNIPLIQQERLKQLGAWLNINGAAIYSTKPWKNSCQWTTGFRPDEEDLSRYVTYDHIMINTIHPKEKQAVIEMFFTYNGSDLFAILPKYRPGALWLQDVEATIDTEISFLANNQKIEWAQIQNNIRISVPDYTNDLLDSRDAYVLKISNVKGFVRTPRIIVEDAGDPTTKVTLQSVHPDAMLFYTLDGSKPSTQSKLYKRPFIVKKPTYLRAKAFVEGLTPSKEISKNIKSNLTFGEVILESHPSDPYKGYSPSLLIDGKRGKEEEMGTGKWMGFLEDDAEIVIDLGEQRKIRKIKLGYLHNPSKNVFAPSAINIEVSNDLFNYKGFKRLSKIREHPLNEEMVDLYETPVYNTNARYIYIHAKNIGVCPSTHPNEGQPSWVFLDEIIIE